MRIDWFTFAAQVINFLILVWLLKRFLYRPILGAIDAREQRIAAEVAEAEAQKAAAQRERDQFHKKNEEFDRQRAALLNQATNEAKAERSRLLDQARQAAENLRTKRQETLKLEQESLGEALTHRAREKVYAIARKTLADLAGATLEERMTEVFLRRLRELDEAGLKRLRSAIAARHNPLMVRTAFTLPAAQRAAIETALSASLGSEVQVQFAAAPDLVSGIEVSADGQKVAWSIADYLAALNRGVDELLKTQPKPEAKAGQGADEPRA